MNDNTENVVDLAALRAERVELASKLRGLVDGEPTDADLAHAEDVAERLYTVVASITAAEQRTDRTADLLASATAILEADAAEIAEVEAETVEVEVAAEPETEAVVETADETEAEEVEVASETEDEDAESESDSDESDTDVTASAATNTTTEASMSENTVNASEALNAVVASGASAETITLAAEVAPVEVSAPALNITASANVPEFAVGAPLNGISDISKALVNRAANLPGFVEGRGRAGEQELHKFSIASVNLEFDPELTVSGDSPGEALRVIDHAGDESRLEGGNVTAAGWCAPSDNLLDICPPASLDGMLDLPEFAVMGGGVNHASGPDFASLYAAGFQQTETEAIAETPKDCIEIPCPTFTETRLDALGLCITGGLLMRAAYPQWVDAFTQRALVAHRHKVNAYNINKVVAGSTALALNTDAFGSTVSDALEMIELVISGERDKFRLGLSQTVDVAVAHWVRGLFRADLSRRVGASPDRPVTNADVDAHFSAIGARVQYLHDFDALPDAFTTPNPSYPDTFRVIVYPAGTFKRAVKPVINLSAVYDAASLTINKYMGLFVEQGALVIKSCYDSFIITLPVCNAGRMGALDLTCAVTP